MIEKELTLFEAFDIMHEQDGTSMKEIPNGD